MAELAETLGYEGHFVEAESLYRETLDIERRVLGPEHPATLSLMSGLAVVLSAEGHYAEAEKLERETLEIRRRRFGPDHPDTAGSTYDLACIEARKGDRDGALSLLREAVDHGLAPLMDLWMQKDPFLKSLHGDPRFDALVAHAKEKAAAAAKK